MATLTALGKLAAQVAAVTPTRVPVVLGHRVLVSRAALAVVHPVAVAAVVVPSALTVAAQQVEPGVLVKVQVSPAQQ